MDSGAARNSAGSDVDGDRDATLWYLVDLYSRRIEHALVVGSAGSDRSAGGDRNRLSGEGAAKGFRIDRLVAAADDAARAGVDGDGAPSGVGEYRRAGPASYAPRGGDGHRPAFESAVLEGAGGNPALRADDPSRAGRDCDSRTDLSGACIVFRRGNVASLDGEDCRMLGNRVALVASLFDGSGEGEGPGAASDGEVFGVDVDGAAAAVADIHRCRRRADDRGGWRIGRFVLGEADAPSPRAGEMNAGSSDRHHGVFVERHAERVVARSRECGAGIQRIIENAGAGVDPASRRRAHAVVVGEGHQIVRARIELHAIAQGAGIALCGKTRSAREAGAPPDEFHCRLFEVRYRRRVLAGDDDPRPVQCERAAHVEVDARHAPRRRSVDHDQVPVSGEEIHVDHQHAAFAEVSREVA